MMNKIKNIVKGFALLSLLVGVFMATPALADNNKANGKDFLNVQASLKADALIRMESSLGVVLGPNGTLRVMGAKVTSVSGNDINVVAPFGNSSLNFVVKTDAQTKVNGKLLTDASLLAKLKDGDKISFAGTITSSTSSSIVVDGDHVVSRALFNAKPEKQNAFQGKVKSVDAANNSFALALKSGVTVKVAVSSSTVISLDGIATTLASLEAGDEVKVWGELNLEGTVITATKISAESASVSTDDTDDEEDDDKDNEKEMKEAKGGWFLGKIRNWLWK